MSDRIDHLQQELTEAVATATERDELTRSLQTEGEERAEDCAALLSSARSWQHATSSSALRMSSGRHSTRKAKATSREDTKQSTMF